MFNEQFFDSNSPIDDRSEITKGQLLATLLAMASKHGMSGHMMQDVLKLLNLVAPGCVPSSNYFLDKIFYDVSASERVKHYYCSRCTNYLGPIQDVLVCEQCETTLTSIAAKKSNNYFIVMSVEEQLREILESDIIAFNQQPSDNISDVTSGNIYKDYSANGHHEHRWGTIK